jgi:hypothetical protein
MLLLIENPIGSRNYKKQLLAMVRIKNLIFIRQRYKKKKKTACYFSRGL